MANRAAQILLFTAKRCFQAICLGSAAASAEPVLFTMQRTVGSIGGSFPTIAVGDLITVKVLANNGGSGFASQNWFQADILSATITIGGTYHGSFAAPYFTNDPLFTTDALDNVNSLFFDLDNNNPDSLGNSVTLTSNAVGSGGSFAYFGNQTAPAWTVGTAPAQVPAPASLSLAVLALGLMGLVARRRRVG